MKKLILVTACVTFCAAASFAQQDTTRKAAPQQTPQSEQLRNDEMKGWTAINQDQIPAELRTTLAGTQYKGWETGTIYRNQAGDMYSVQINDGTSTTPKTYYFDKTGKAAKKPNKSNN